ncbi:hypothetical protein BOTNAR_0052g00080 [Botryotinia narcissicola]|uniref:Uncharacterized protein n=1 Tax=Botryotinia narcissicola TaxID=278944 RepID=A0A4Z1JCG2_9HELO|nr:hypothetical protein BOTNAR_0052g00080 [Botryotinia narcissicola]
MSSTNNGKGSFIGPFYPDGNSSSDSAELVKGKKPPKTSSTKPPQASSSGTVRQLKDDSESNSDRRREVRSETHKDLTGRYPSSSDSDKNEKEKAKK